MLEASQDKCERLSIECEILTEKKAKHAEILAKQKELTSTIQAQKISKSEYDNAISTVMLSIFEMFFVDRRLTSKEEAKHNTKTIK